jgi:hypothetical protein
MTMSAYLVGYYRLLAIHRWRVQTNLTVVSPDMALTRGPGTYRSFSLPIAAHCLADAGLL